MTSPTKKFRYVVLLFILTVLVWCGFGGFAAELILKSPQTAVLGIAGIAMLTALTCVVHRRAARWYFSHDRTEPGVLTMLQTDATKLVSGQYVRTSSGDGMPSSPTKEFRYVVFPHDEAVVIIEDDGELQNLAVNDFAARSLVTEIKRRQNMAEAVVVIEDDGKLL